MPCPDPHAFQCERYALALSLMVAGSSFVSRATSECVAATARRHCSRALETWLFYPASVHREREQSCHALGKTQGSEKLDRFSEQPVDGSIVAFGREDRGDYLFRFRC
jgi:hypothetical protein